MSRELFKISKAPYIPEHLSMAASACRISMRKSLSRLEKKLVAMNNRDF